MTSTIKVDTISENTSANGVSIDGLTIKDGGIKGTGAQSLVVGSTDGTSARLVLDATNGDAAGGDFPVLTADGTSLSIAANNSGGNAFITFQTNSGEDMRLDSSGKLLIGTTDIGYSGFGDDLTIGSANGNNGMTIRSGTSNYGTFYFSDATGTGTGTYAGKIQYNHSDNSMRIATNSVDKLAIDSAGNVGIGEFVPLGKLHVRTADTGASASNDANELILEQNGASGLTILSANNSQGNIFFGDAQDNDVGRIIYNHSNNNMSFRSNATEFLRADEDGHVTMPKQSSFRATPSGSQGNISINAWNTIAFENEAVDTNADFASSTFTAPVAGTYALSGAIYLQALDSGASSYQVEIHTSNDSYGILVIIPAQILSADTGFYAFAGSVFADMDAGDTAIVRIFQENGTAQTNINVTSVFTGHLLG